jgi:tetratricopeptide (TPR) repeat protein
MLLTRIATANLILPFLVFLVCLGNGNSQQTPHDALAVPRKLLMQGKLAESETSLHSYLASKSSSPEAHFLLGYVLFREQKAVESLAQFTAGAKFQRPTADELKTVASDYVLLGDYADADKWFTEVKTEKPDDADAWYLLGRTKYNENAFEDAASSFERALVLQPRYVEAENNLGLALRELNQPEKAKNAFKTAIEWEGKSPNDAQPFLNLGTLLADEGALDTALPLLLKAANLSPDNPKMHEELGSVYEQQKDLVKAQAELEQAVALAPNASGLHFKLGQIYRHEGLRERAQQQFDLCEKLNSSHSSAITPNAVEPAPH